MNPGLAPRLVAGAGKPAASAPGAGHGVTTDDPLGVAAARLPLVASARHASPTGAGVARQRAAAGACLIAGVVVPTAAAPRRYDGRWAVGVVSAPRARVARLLACTHARARVPCVHCTGPPAAGVRTVAKHAVVAGGRIRDVRAARDAAAIGRAGVAVVALAVAHAPSGIKTCVARCRIGHHARVHARARVRTHAPVPRHDALDAARGGVAPLPFLATIRPRRLQAHPIQATRLGTGRSLGAVEIGGALRRRAGLGRRWTASRRDTAPSQTLGAIRALAVPRAGHVLAAAGDQDGHPHRGANLGPNRPRREYPAAVVQEGDAHQVGSAPEAVELAHPQPTEKVVVVADPRLALRGRGSVRRGHESAHPRHLSTPGVVRLQIDEEFERVVPTSTEGDAREDEEKPTTEHRPQV